MDRCSGILSQLYRSLTQIIHSKNRYKRLVHADQRRPRPRKKLKSLKLGGTYWRFRIRRPRASRLLFSPLSLLKNLRDSYVRMMISVASKGNWSGAMYAAGTVYTANRNPGRQIQMRDDDVLAYIEYLKQREQLQRALSCKTAIVAT